jgi:hypothetical protein
MKLPFEVVRFLIRPNMNVKFVDRVRRTALHWCAIHSDNGNFGWLVGWLVGWLILILVDASKIADLLIKNHYEVQAKDRFNRTPLHYASLRLVLVRVYLCARGCVYVRVVVFVCAMVFA